MNVRNHIHLTGNLGADPKTVVLESGTTATEFSLATNEYYRDRDGNRQTKTEWHRLKAYGKLAELFDQYLQRGSQISVVGSMKYRKWTDKFEQTRTAAEVIVEEFTFLSSGKQRGEEATAPAMVAEPETSRSKKKTANRRAKKATAQSVEA